MMNRKPQCMQGHRPPLVGPGATPCATRPVGAGGSPAAAWSKNLCDHRYLILLSIMLCSLIVDSIERRLIGVAALAELLVEVSLFVMVLVVFEGRRTRPLALLGLVVVVLLGWAQYALPDDSPSWIEVLQKLPLVLFDG